LSGGYRYDNRRLSNVDIVYKQFVVAADSHRDMYAATNNYYKRGRHFNNVP